MNKNKGFTLVELLVVLVIVAILAAIATPLYLQNSKRSKASEALAVLALVRQDEREYSVNHNNAYYDVASPNIASATPTSVAADGTPTPSAAGAGVTIGTAQYFPAASYSVYAGSDLATSTPATIYGLFTNPVAQNFVIVADGSVTGTSDCTTSTSPTNCALHNADVNTFKLAMDNTGRTFVCYDTCGTASNWSAY